MFEHVYKNWMDGTLMTHLRALAHTLTRSHARNVRCELFQFFFLPHFYYAKSIKTHIEFIQYHI